MIPVVGGSSPLGHPKPTKWRAPALRQDALAPALQALLRAALVQVERNARYACSSPDPEYLHQLRVGLRRLRATLRAFRGVLPKAELQTLRNCHRRLRMPLGRARDLDVFTLWLQSASAPEKLLEQALQRRREAHAQARRALSSPAFARLVALVRSLVARNGNLDMLARRAAADARRAVLRHAGRMKWSRQADLHELRIRVRRERYIREAFLQPAEGLKALQDTLGELNDVAVARRLLARITSNKALNASLSVRAEALFGVLRENWSAYLAARTLPRPATAKAGAGARAPAPRGRFPPRTRAARPAAGGPAPAR